MKLLICTQTVDRTDSVLGFFHQWIAEFAKHCEQVTVICLREGEHALPVNVRVYSLGKERGEVSKFFYAWRFLRLVWRLRNTYDVVFVHMNPEYVVLGGVLWRAWGKRTGLWYVHKSVDIKLRIATLFAHAVFTASPESFRLATGKLRVLGHGIDPSFFQTHTRKLDVVRLITVGRISETKRPKEMFAAADELYAEGKSFTFTVAGAPATERDKTYAAELEQLVASKPYRASIRLLGVVSHGTLPGILADADIFLNLSATGSLDKAVLEALASELVVVSSNEAFRDMLEPYGLFASSIDPRTLAGIISRAVSADLPPLAPLVAERHSLARLVPAILAALYS